MEVKVIRKYRNVVNGSRTYCVDKVYVDGSYVCDAMEDKDWGWTKETPVSEITRIKKAYPSRTAIPRGRYALDMDTVSPRFGKSAFYRQYANGGRVPRLKDVPGFDGILIHCGNSEQASAGCIIVGMNTTVGQVLKSQVTFRKLYPMLLAAHKKGEAIYVEIE